MGMFDKPQYLTGPNGYVGPGETFWLHKARLDGTVTVSGTQREQVKMEVSHERDGEREVVFTSGTGIVGQVRRMSATDIDNMPIEVRIDQVPSRQGNPTNVLSLSSAPPAASTVDDSDISF